jgi:hypothetical protein
MNRILTGVLVVFLLIGWKVKSDLYPPVVNKSFSRGEVLEYRASFGIFTVGHGVTQVGDKITMINGRPCYKIDAFGTTSGLVAWVNKVDDLWGAFVDTAALVTHVSYRKIREGHYRKDELVTYDHENLKAEVKVINKQTGAYDPAKYYNTPDHVRDIMGGFAYLRVYDFNKTRIGDTITIGGFFEDSAYKIRIIYSGKEKVRTKLGKIMCHKLVPIVPDNKIFDGENSITTWLSADDNQILVKVQAKMFIGTTGLELEQFRGLRNQLRIVEK